VSLLHAMRQATLSYLHVNVRVSHLGKLAGSTYLSKPQPSHRSVIEQHKFSRDQWEDRITNWFGEHRGMLK